MKQSVGDGRERWEEVEDFPDYMVSDRGRVLSWRNPVNPIFLSTDSQCVTLHSKDDTYTIRIERLVMRAFVSEIPYGFVIDHIDGNVHNNALSNLRFVSRRVKRGKRYAECR